MNFTGVHEQVHENLPQHTAVGVDDPGRAPVSTLSATPASLARLSTCATALSMGFAKPSLLVGWDQLACVPAGDVHRVVEQRRQVGGAHLNPLDVVLLLVRERAAFRVGQQVGVSDNGGQRRLDFVAQGSR